MKKIVAYDTHNDILMIHNGFSGDERFKGNIDAGELILDVSTQGRIRGIEVINATAFFKDFAITPVVLENLLDADFTATMTPQRILLGFVFKSKTSMMEIPATVVVPLEVPARW